MNKTYNSLYSFYELYEITHGRSLAYKMYECFAAQEFLLEMKHIRKTLPFLKDITLLEQFAGRGEYTKAWHLNAEQSSLAKFLTPKKAFLQDISVPKITQNYAYIKSSVTDEVPTKHAGHPVLPNVILAPYYSINGLTDRAFIVAWFKKVAEHFHKIKGGVLYLHFSDNAEETKLEMLGTSSKELYYVPPFSPLRSEIKAREDSDLKVRMTTRRSYDRLTGISHEHFSNISFIQNGKDLGRKTIIKNPLSFRYWTEAEIVSMLAESGFDIDKSLFGYIDFGSVNPILSLKSKLKNHDPEGYEPPFSNCILAVAK